MHPPIRPLLPFIAAVLIAGCGSSSTPASATPRASAKVASASPVRTSAPSRAPSASTKTVSQTDTEWGRIQDVLPSGFPMFPGAKRADDAEADPVSGAFSVRGDAHQIAQWMQTALQAARFGTEGLSGPFEDGSYVLDSNGRGTCRVQTTVAPQGNLIMITVLYGATCPTS